MNTTEPCRSYQWAQTENRHAKTVPAVSAHAATSTISSHGFIETGTISQNTGFTFAILLKQQRTGLKSSQNRSNERPGEDPLTTSFICSGHINERIK
jgi:hypothetical protein